MAMKRRIRLENATTAAPKGPHPSAAERAGRLTRRGFLAGATAAAGMLASPWIGLTAGAEAVPDADERAKVEAALPAKAPAQPRKARRLLIFDLNVQYGGHRSIATANLAFTLMGRKTGAFETVISRDPAVFRPRSSA